MTAAQRQTFDFANPLARALNMRGAIAEIMPAAIALCVERNIEETIRKWLAHARIAPDQSMIEALAAEASFLARELAIFAPSMSGTRPIDRLARQFKARTRDEDAAVKCLTQAKFRLFRVVSKTSESIFTAKDLASGGSFRLFEESLLSTAVGQDIAARLCPIDGALNVMTGPMVPLDGGRLLAVSDFIRPGKGLINDQRCAAAVYRDYLRHGGAAALDFGIQRNPEACFSLSRPDEELDSFANDWAEFGQGAHPTGEALHDARNLTSAGRLAAALNSCIELRRVGKTDLAQVYRNLAAIQMETFHLRAQVGSGDPNPFETLRIAFEEQATKRKFSSEALKLFGELARQILAKSGGTRSRDEDLSRVIERIRGLRAKTTDQGCTEQEALAAADKVAEMLERYGLSLSEIEIRQQTCEGFGIDTGRRKHGPFDRCVPAIADFCDCRTWSETSASGTLRFIFFGLPADVEAAHYLYDLVAIAFETETTTFKSGSIYVSMYGADKRGSVTSFQIGLARGISAKLEKLRAERHAATFKSTGRDLVPIKTSILDFEFERLGFSLHSRRIGRRRKVLADAYEAGHVAGGKFEVHAGIN